MIIPYTKFEDFGIIRFWVMKIFIHHIMVMLRSADKHADADERFTPANVVGVSNNNNINNNNNNNNISIYQLNETTLSSFLISLLGRKRFAQ